MSTNSPWTYLLILLIALFIGNCRCCFSLLPLSECHIINQCCKEQRDQCSLATYVFRHSSTEESKAKVDRIIELDEIESSSPSDSEYLDFTNWLKFLQQKYHLLFPIDREHENYVRSVKNALFSLVSPTPFRTRVKLVAVADDVLTKCLDLKPEVIKSSQFLDFVSGNNQSGVFPPSLAHRYGGHQFGYWAGQLGDGRAHLLGIYTSKDGNHWELQLKGSGMTPYSRRGDGRAVLRSSIREFLASEAMHYLGVPTSRALSLVVSNDNVIRDQFYDGHPVAERGAVVLRLAPSWFRIGSLEILAQSGELTLLKSLLDYVIEMHFAHININDKDKYLLLYQEIVTQTARMISLWQSIGFTHGVCNTDNFSLLSITIDYGPFGFMEEYNPAFIPNTSDDEGRYSYQNQPDIGFYNLEKLRLALEPVLVGSQIETSRIILHDYASEYHQQYLNIFKNKIGLSSVRETDAKLFALFFTIMQEMKTDFAMSFRQLGEISLKQALKGNISRDFWALKQLQKHKLFTKFLKLYSRRLKLDSVNDTARRAKMARYNPVYVLRNWMAEIAINKADNNDFSEVQKLYRVLKHPFIRQEEAEEAGFASKPPSWASHIKVSCSS